MTAPTAADDNEQAVAEAAFCSHPQWTDAARLLYIVQAATDNGRRLAAQPERRAPVWTDASS